MEKKTISNKRALLSVILVLPFEVATYYAAIAANGEGFFQTYTELAFTVTMFLCLCVMLPHELLHLAGWMIATGTRSCVGKIKFNLPFKASVTFKGVISVRHFIFGALFPFIILSIIPVAAGIVFNNLYLVIIGMIHATGCCSDLILSIMLLPCLGKYCYDPEDETGVIVTDKQEVAL